MAAPFTSFLRRASQGVLFWLRTFRLMHASGERKLVGMENSTPED